MQQEPVKGLLALSLILLPLEVIIASLSGFDFAHYFLTSLPVVSLLLAFLVWLTLKQHLIAPTLLTAALLLGAFYFSLPLSNFARLAEKYTADSLIVEDRESLVAARVREATEPGDRILVWGKALGYICLPIVMRRPVTSGTMRWSSRISPLNPCVTSLFLI